MGIPFYLQYYVEKDRSNRFQWLNYGILIGSLVIYGIFLHWIPMWIRSKRDQASHKNKRYFAFIKWVDIFNSTFHFNIPITKKTVYYQPSLIFIYCIFMAINAVFCFVQTKDIDYLPQQYVIAKRVGKVALGNFPAIYLLVIKNDFLTALTGFQHDRLVMIHKWLARMIFVMTAFHIGYCARYWLHLGFPIMLIIPPQIFGYIATVCFIGLTFGSAKFIRKFAYDAFLIEHRVFSFIFLLMVFFHHRKSTTGAIVLAVHQLVLDRIASRVLALIQKRMGPTKGRSTFEILDEETMLVTIPIKAFPFHERPWWSIPLPKCNTWKAGQHVYLTVSKISLFQMHPFTIASLSESGEIKLVIRQQKGFTKKLMKKIIKMKQEKEEAKQLNGSESDGSTGLDDTTNTSTGIDVETELITSSGNPNTKKKNNDNTGDNSEDLESDGDDVIMKATIVGPVGARYLPLITFDSVVFFCAGSGGAFCFPVALDLLQTMEKRNFKEDYLNRNPNEKVRIVWAIRRAADALWFKFVLDELMPFCNKGMLTIDFHITQEQTLPYAGDSVHKETIAVEGGSGDYDISVEKSHINSISKKDTYTSLPSCNLYSADNVFYHLGRPDADAIITSHVDELKHPSDLKSLAVLSCGLSKFTHAIKDSCQKNKWSTNGPDIYCYTESFD